MLEKLPTIPQDDNDIKFAEQYVQATELFITAVKKSNIGWFKRFNLIYKASRKQQDIMNRITAANNGDMTQLESALDVMRNNFNTIMNDVFKMHPSLIAKTQKELSKEKPMFQPHGMDGPMKAEDYFRIYGTKAENQEKEKGEKVTPVRIVNKTSIPVRLIGNQMFPDKDMREERSLRHKLFGFLSYSERNRTGRNIFQGGRSAVRGVSNVLTNRGGVGQSIVDLPNLISFGLIKMFGGSLRLAGALLMTGLKTVFKLGLARLALVAIPFMADLAKDGIGKVMNYIFGEDSGITKVVKDFFNSDIFSSGITGGALGAGLGILFGPAGMFWGFIIGSISGMLKSWIDDDGPKKLLEGMSKLWDAMKTGVDNFVTALVTPISEFFKKIQDYVTDKLKFFGIGVSDQEKKDNIVKENQNVQQKVDYYTERSQDMSLPLWQRNNFKTKAENERTFLKSDAQVQNEVMAIDKNSADEKVKNDKLRAAIFDQKKIIDAEKLAQRQAQDPNYKPKSAEILRMVTEGKQAPISYGPTAQLHDMMIGQKRMEFMNTIAPTIVSSPTNVINSTNVSQRTNNSMSMQLSPISNDRIK